MFQSPRLRLFAVSLGGLLAVLLVAVVALWGLQRGQVLPNTSVAGIEVGGLEQQEVRDRLAGLVGEREDTPVALLFEGEEHELHPGDIDFHVDLDATVQAALSRGRTGLPGDVAVRVASLWRERDLGVVERWDDDALEEWLQTTADALDRDETLGSVEVDPETLEVDVQLPQGRVEVRRDETRQRIVEGLTGEGPRRVELPAETTAQPADDAVVEEAAEQVRQAVENDLVLRVEDTAMTVERTQLAQLLDVRPNDDEDALELVVTEQRVEDVIGQEASETFDLAPRSATYTRARTPPTQHDDQGSTTFAPVSAEVGLEPGADGREFSAEMSAEQLTELLREGADEAQLRTETIEADLPTDTAEQQRPTHLLGTFTTYYQAGQVRNANIQLLADVIDGAMVPPGEQFSINEISGPRSCSKGYEPAGTIVQGELVDTCGGGTSQFGTTTFNAAFFAGVQLDQWKAHSWYISRYPMGREATLSYPQLDVKFTNDTEGAILVKTDHTSTSVTVSVYGQPLADRVRAQHGEPTNHRSYQTEVRTTSDLPEGQQRVLQSGSGGFSVQVTRTVERDGGADDVRTINTTYQPQTRIIERGTG